MSALLEDHFSPALIAEFRAEMEGILSQAFARRDETAAKRWLTVSEAAQYLGTTERAVYQRIHRGRIPGDAVKHSGRSVLIDKVELDRALENG